jgi:hypothetical protein
MVIFLFNQQIKIVTEVSFNLMLLPKMRKDKLESHLDMKAKKDFIYWSFYQEKINKLDLEKSKIPYIQF